MNGRWVAADARWIPPCPLGYMVQASENGWADTQMIYRLQVLWLVAMTTVFAPIARADPPIRVNGFDLSSLTVPRQDVAGGGPPRDGIPALTDPAFIRAAQATWLHDDARVLGVVLNGVAKAYPLDILAWHEIVNDRFGKQPILVTYCPLCFTGMAFEADAGGRRRVFGVSGLLYNSNVLLYDHATNSLWSQVLGRAVSGPLAGTKLEMIAADNTSWPVWRKAHPDTLVLSRDTGYARNYGRDPYAWYDQSPDVGFPIASRSSAYHPKMYVLGIVVGDDARVYPFSELDAVAQNAADRDHVQIQDRVGGTPLTVHYNYAALSAYVTDSKGQEMPSTMAYWFSWYAFHPRSRVFHAPTPGPAPRR